MKRILRSRRSANDAAVFIKKEKKINKNRQPSPQTVSIMATVLDVVRAAENPTTLAELNRKSWDNMDNNLEKMNAKLDVLEKATRLRIEEASNLFKALQFYVHPWEMNVPVHNTIFFDVFWVDSEKDRMIDVKLELNKWANDWTVGMLCAFIAQRMNLFIDEFELSFYKDMNLTFGYKLDAREGFNENRLVHLIIRPRENRDPSDSETFHIFARRIKSAASI